MTIHNVRRGSGKPLLLIHGLGSSRKSWETIHLALAEQREVIAIDLPGHGETPAEADSGTFAGLVRSLDEWLEAEGLAGVDMVGSSMGARLSLEMARRGRAGAVVALDPGGFWQGWERTFLSTSLSASVALLRTISPALPVLAHSPVGRAVLLPQLSARPWALNGDYIEDELTAFAATPTFDALAHDLAYGPVQEGPAAGSRPVAIGWGRHDRLCLPVQAERALGAFPSARLVWFEESGHFPLWDQPTETLDLIRETIN